MKFRRIASTRTDHFCNFGGIAKTLFCCRRKCLPEHGKSLSAVSGHKRYNTLDFAEQNRVPTGYCSPLLDDPEPKGTALWNPVFFVIGTQTQKAVCDRYEEKRKHLRSLQLTQCFLLLQRIKTVSLILCNCRNREKRKNREVTI